MEKFAIVIEGEREYDALREAEKVMLDLLGGDDYCVDALDRCPYRKLIRVTGCGESSILPRND
jgi:hypothetical protein